MKSKHITEIIDGAAFADLSEQDLAIIRTHVADCPNCKQAFKAAQVTSVLLKAKSEIPAPTPSPFFQAKVINALRERQNLQKPIEAFRRWWQASAAMVGLMVIIVACLVATSFMIPLASEDEVQAGTNFNLYTTDSVILNQKSPRDLTNEQVFQVIYNPRNDFKK